MKAQKVEKNQKTLSVAFLYDDSLDGTDGVSQQVRRIGEWLSSQGHHVSYFVGETKLNAWAGGEVFSLAKNLKVSFNSNRLSIPLVSRKSAIKRALAKASPDVLHVQSPYSPMMSARVIKLSAPSVAVVGTFHILPSGLLARFGSRLLGLVLRRTLRRFDQMISVSKPAAEFARNSYGIDSIVIPNTVDTSAFIGSKSSRRSEPHIVFLGRLVERKGCRELIEAFELLHKKLPTAKLTIAGDGPQRTGLEALVSKLELDGYVSFLGYIDETEKAALLASADIACFPSKGGESFGIVLVEAMAAGSRVVIGGDNPGYRSVLGDRPELLVDPLDKVALADRLERFLTDSAAAEAINRWQNETVRQYDIEAVGRRIMKVYLDSIAKRAAPRA